MKYFKRTLNIAIAFFLGLEILLFTHLFDPLIFSTVSRLTSWPIQATWPARLQTIAWITLLVGCAAYLLLYFKVVDRGRILGILGSWRGWRIAGQVFARFPEPLDPQPPLRWNILDGLVILLFIVFGVVLFLSMLRGPLPHIHIGGDGANLASFAAGLDHPAGFTGDEILSDPGNLRSYSTLNVQLIRWLTLWTGSYALSFALPILVLAPLNLAGFYLLGCIFFRRRFWAFLLALALAVPLKINMGETWGITLDPVTRFYFQALIPFMLVLMLAWRGQPRRWPWLAALVGLMAFIHPVSTPAWAAAIWLGFAVCLPAAWHWQKKIGVLAGLALITLAALTPYAFNYFGSNPAQGALSFQTALSIINDHFPAGLMNVPVLLGELGAIFWKTGLLGASLLAGASLILLPARERTPQKLALAWLAGIFLASAVIPWIEHTLEAALRIVPFETEMVRGLRYVVFFLVLFPVWALAEWQRRLANPRWQAAVAALGVGLLVAWGGAANLSEVFPAQLVSCMQQGRLVCGEPDDSDLLVDAVARLTPPGAVVYSSFADQSSSNYSLPIRYQALRSLVFCYKDRGQLVTAHSPAAETWLARLNDLRNVLRKPPDQQMDGHVQLAREWGAGYLLTGLNLPADWLRALGLTVLYQNDTYALLQLR